MRFIILILSLLLGQCTGVNLRILPIPASPNMNPSPAYAHPGVLWRGGLFYHYHTNVIFTGDGKIIRKGRACSHSFFYLFALGDSRIDTAKVNGGVSVPAFIEQETLAVLGFFYHRHCTIVLGESF